MITFPKRHPYISATIVATLLAIVVWLCMPKEYSAITKLSDEYQETDIAIGLDNIRALQRKAEGKTNNGINNMEVYCKILKTEDFARSISHKQVQGKNITYGEYIGERDTIKTIIKRINYNYSSNHETLTITFTDRDPLIAAQMLDSVTVSLQNVVSESRHKMAEAALKDAVKKRETTIKEYHKAQNNYAAYLDSHLTSSTLAAKQQEAALQKEVDLAYQNYKKSIETCVRQQALLQRAYLSFAVIQNNKVPTKRDGSIWAYLISSIFISLVITFWGRQYMKDKSVIKRLDFGNIFAPWTITILIWIAVILGIYMLGDRLYPLTSQFYICISLWISIFCISAFITYNLYQRSELHEKAIIKSLHLNKLYFYFLLIVSLTFSPLCVKKVFDIISAFSTENLMQAIRVLAVYGEGFGIIDFSFVINKALLLVVLWRYPQISFKTIILIIGLALLNSFAVMDKGTIFFIIIIIAFILYEKHIIKIYHMVIGAVAVVSFFFILTVMRDISGNYENMEFLYFLSEYIFANPVAFSYLPESVSPQFGANTLFLIYYYLNRFGIGGYEVVNIQQETVEVPVHTNLYTIMQPFYVDFGILGVAFFALVYGVAIGWCYRSYKNGDSTAKCMYTYLVMVMILQFGQEQIFLTPVVFLRVWLFVYLMTQSRIKLSMR